MKNTINTILGGLLPQTVLAVGLFLALFSAGLVDAGQKRLNLYRVGYVNLLSEDANSDPAIDEVYLRVWYPLSWKARPILRGATRAEYNGGILETDIIDAEIPSVRSRFAWDGNSAYLPVAKGKFPVVLVTPSFTFPPDITLGDYAEALASQGIIVVLAERTNDGLRCRLNRPGDGVDVSCTTNDIPSNFIGSDSGRAQISESRSEDLLTALDLIEELNEESGMFYRSMNLRRLALFGYSASGYSHLSLLDKIDYDRRVKALLLLDPVFLPQDPNRFENVTIPTLLLSVSLTGDSIRPGLTPIDPSRIFEGGFDTITFGDDCDNIELAEDVTVCIDVGLPRRDLLNSPDLVKAIGTPNRKITHVQLLEAAHDGFGSCEFPDYLNQLKALSDEGKTPGLRNTAQLDNLINESRLPCENRLYSGQAIDDVFDIDLINPDLHKRIALQYVIAFARVHLLKDRRFNSLLGKRAASRLGTPVRFWKTRNDSVILGD